MFLGVLSLLLLLLLAFLLYIVYSCFRAVHVTRFTSDNLHILSGGDDKVVNLLDIPSQAKVASFSEHQVSKFSRISH